MNLVILIAFCVLCFGLSGFLFWKFITLQEQLDRERRYRDTYNKCEECQEDFTYKDIDGGRCLSCGRMICGY